MTNMLNLSGATSGPAVFCLKYFNVFMHSCAYYFMLLKLKHVLLLEPSLHKLIYIILCRVLFNKVKAPWFDILKTHSSLFCLNGHLNILLSTTVNLAMLFKMILCLYMLLILILSTVIHTYN